MIQNLMNAIMPSVGTVIDRVIPDKNHAERARQEIEKAILDNAHQINLAQIEVNKQEAQGNWFQRGWRPATGWVCVLGFMVNFLVSPIASGFGIDIPQADTSTMLPVLMGMLGLGGLRSYEKVKDKTR
jgi:hypothetical protein